MQRIYAFFCSASRGHWCTVQVPLYKGLHRAPGSVAENSVNLYGRKLWWMVLFYVALHPRKESCLLSLARQNGSQESVKKLLHFCYTTTWTNQLDSCYTTKYERVVHFPLSPQTAVIQQVTAIFQLWSGLDLLFWYHTLKSRKLSTKFCLQPSWLHLSQKSVFPQTWSWEQRKITAWSFFSFLIYTFVGAHFSGHKVNMLFASALSWRCGNSPQQQTPLDLPVTILRDWNTTISVAVNKLPSGKTENVILYTFYISSPCRIP